MSFPVFVFLLSLHCHSVNPALFDRESEDLDAAQVYLTQLTKSKFGNSFRYSREFRDGENKTLNGEFCLGLDGSRYRNVVNITSINSGKKRTTVTRKYRRSDLLFTTVKSQVAGRSPKTTFIAHGDMGNRPQDFGLLDVVFGYDPVATKFWFETLRDGSKDATVDSFESGFSVVLDSEQNGRIDFTFERSKERISLKRLEITREKGDIVVLPSGETCRLGEGVLESQYLYKQVLSDFDFKQDDPVELRSVTVTRFFEYEGNKTETSEYGVLVRRMIPLQSDLEKEISFPNFSIPNGTAVKMRNDEKIPYQFWDGKVVKMVADLNEISELETQFENPTSSNAPFVLVFVGLAVIVIAVFFKVYLK